MKNYENKEVKMKNIIEPPHQLRMEINEEDINELALSIDQHGLINPITIQEDQEGRLIIIAGHRRFLAVKKLGRKTIHTRVLKNTTKTEVTVIAAIENLQRSDMNIIEEADLINGLHFDGKLSCGEISDLLSRSREWVLKRIELQQYPKEILQALHEGSIKLGVARLIATIQKDAFRAWVLTQAIASGATISMVKVWIRDSTVELSTEDAQKIIQEFSNSTMEYLESSKFTCEMCYREDSLVHVIIVRVCKQCALQISAANEQYKYEKRLTEEQQGGEKKDGN